MSQARQETLHQAPFTVQVTDAILEVRALYNASPAPTLARLGHLDTEVGLFSVMSAFLRLDSKEQAYDAHFLANYHVAQSSYWHGKEIEELQVLLSAQYPTSRVFGQKDSRGTDCLFVYDPSEEVVMCTHLGWPDEKTNWTQQVRDLDKKVRASEYGKLAHEDELQKLLDDKSVPLMNDPLRLLLFMPHTHREGPSIQFGDDQEFMRRMRVWATFIERVINNLSHIKETPQPGTLLLGRPSLD